MGQCPGSGPTMQKIIEFEKAMDTDTELGTCGRLTGGLAPQMAHCFLCVVADASLRSPKFSMKAHHGCGQLRSG